MSLKTSLLAFTAVEIAIIAIVIALCAVLFVVSVILFVLTKKRNKSAEQLYRQKNETPIIIYQTKRIEVSQEAQTPHVTELQETEVPHVTDVLQETDLPQMDDVPQEIEVPYEEEEYEEIPTVMGEIAAAEAAEAAVKIPVNDESPENAMRYNLSFRGRLLQSSDEVKEWYVILKNAILSHDRVSSRIGRDYESFYFKRNVPLANIFIKNKTIYLYLPLNAADYADSKYKLEDASKVSQFADTPALYQIKSDRRLTFAQELIDEACKKLGSAKRKI